MLKWLVGERQVYPDEDGARLAALRGHVRVVEWLEEQEIYQTEDQDPFEINTPHQGLFCIAQDIYLNNPNSCKQLLAWMLADPSKF